MLLKTKNCLFQQERNIAERENTPVSITRIFSFFQQCFNSFPNKPWFLRVCNKSLLRTLWEKEKLLVTSNFSFSHSVFYPFGELSAIFYQI